MHDNICKICGRHFQSRWPSTLCSEACARENSRRWQRTHKKNCLGWLVTMRAEDLFELYREWEAGMDLKARGDHEAGEGGPTA